MYHAIVRRKVRRAFAGLSRGEADEVVADFANDGLFVFTGTHALAARLSGPDQVARWFDRVFRIMPGMQFEPVEIVVAGGPWNTVVTTRLKLNAQLPGYLYVNEGVQFLRLRWGKVTEDRVYEDTQKVAEALSHLAASGVTEASAPQLESEE